ncbi:MAG: ATP-dependent 6-phosphofructokinase [Clostridia bacterium]
MRKIGILTGGGDCPGLNAVIRGIVESCENGGVSVYGFFDGWRGALTGEGKLLTLKDVDGIQTKGGTILGSSRTNVMKIENGPQTIKATMAALDLEGLAAIGGDDTLGVANKLRKEYGMNMVGVPKTIDNDLSCTDYTFGFDTASNIAMEAIDRLHTTAASHSRCMIVECMGRHTGWIALQAGLAGNAHLVLIPEFKKTFEEIYTIVKNRYLRGEKYTLISVAEGFELGGDDEDLGFDTFGNKLLINREIGKTLSDRLEKAMREDPELPEKRKYFECRSVILGHLQRGGAPSAFDRVLGTRLGVKAGELVVNGEYGNMVALNGTRIVAADLDKAVTERKCVDAEFYNAAALYFK